MSNAPKLSKQPQDDIISSAPSTCRDGPGSVRVPAACQDIIRNKKRKDYVYSIHSHHEA